MEEGFKGGRRDPDDLLSCFYNPLYGLYPLLPLCDFHLVDSPYCLFFLFMLHCLMGE